MSDVIGKGVIEVSADSTKLKAGIDDAKRSIRSLGEANKDASTKASQSIDRYVKRLEVQNATLGKSAREAELYRLKLRGATKEQLAAADSALRLTEAYQRGALIGDRIRTGMIASAAAAALAAGAITTLIISSVNAADRLSKLSKTTGITVENLSGLAFAAEQSGSDLEGVAKSVSELSKRIGKDGDKFRELGISAKDPLEALKQLSDIFVRIKDPQIRAALGADALGKSWETTAPLLLEGGKSIGEMIEKGKKLSGVTTEMAEESAKFNDQLDELKTTAGGLGTKLAGEMLPAFNDIIKAVKLAYEESGKLSALWVGMGALGAFLFTDEFSSATVKIKNLQGQINALEEDKKKLKGGGYIQQFLFGTAGEIDKKIENLKAQIASIEDGAKPKATIAESTEEAGRKAKAAAEAEAKAKKFLSGNSSNAAKQEANARLVADLDQIKKASGAITETFDNAEKIMQARRAAGLVNEREYYDSKLGFLRLNQDAQEAALQQEIARLQKERLSGKEKIDNDRKIADAQSRLASIRADAVANIEVLATQEKDANDKIAQSYINAEAAAQSYIDTIAKQSSRELAGLGRGELQREVDARRSQREDQFQGRKDGLDRDLRTKQITQEEFDTFLAIEQAAHQKALANDEQYWAKKLELQGSFSLGASEALQNYYDESQNVFAQTAEAVDGAFRSMEDALVDFVRTGKLDFKSLADSIIADMARIIIKQQIAGIAKSIFGAMGGGAGGLVQLAGPVAHTGGIIGSDTLPTRSFSIPRFHTGGIAGNEVPAILERGEGVFTKEQMKALSPAGGSAPINIQNTYNVASGIDQGQLRAQMEKVAQINDAQLVEKLKRARQI
jgi:lambda family phage tail tape measure protein